MIAFLFASSLLVPSGAAPASPPRLSTTDEVFDRRFGEAANDLDALWDLVSWCESTERDKEARSVLRKILDLAPDNSRAHQKLGHVFYEGEWYPSQKKVDEFIRSSTKRAAKERGLVRFRGAWTRPDYLPYLKRGLVRDELGLWITKDDERRLAKGWVRQDMELVPPHELEQFNAGLFRVEGDWISPDEAAAYHSKLGRWWSLVGRRVVLLSTCDRSVGLRALKDLDDAYDELVRIYGREPAAFPRVVLARNSEQFDRFATGAAEFWSTVADLSGQARKHHAFFAEGWVEPKDRIFRGMGAGYWDSSSEVRERLGRCSVRHALGLSFGEAVDPSPKAEGKARKAKPNKDGVFLTDGWVKSFWKEKQVPAWFRFGAASYVERYYEDKNIDSGGDRFWTRKWSLEDLSRGGGLSSLESVFECDLKAAGGRAGHLLNEVGLLVAFVLDGKCDPVVKAHRAVTEAFARHADVDKLLAELRRAIEANESSLRAFAGL